MCSYKSEEIVPSEEKRFYFHHSPYTVHGVSLVKAGLDTPLPCNYTDMSLPPDAEHRGSAHVSMMERYPVNHSRYFPGSVPYDGTTEMRFGNNIAISWYRTCTNLRLWQWKVGTGGEYMDTAPEPQVKGSGKCPTMRILAPFRQRLRVKSILIK